MPCSKVAEGAELPAFHPRRHVICPALGDATRDFSPFSHPMMLEEPLCRDKPRLTGLLRGCALSRGRSAACHHDHLGPAESSSASSSLSSPPEWSWERGAGSAKGPGSRNPDGSATSRTASPRSGTEHVTGSASSATGSADGTAPTWGNAVFRVARRLLTIGVVCGLIRYVQDDGAEGMPRFVIALVEELAVVTL